MDIQVDILVAQIINFLIIFFLFKKFFGDKIITLVEERRLLIKRLKKADQEYQNIINSAKEEADTLLQDTQKKKEQLLSKAKKSAEEAKLDILSLAQKEASQITKNAEQKAEHLQKEIYKERESSVKSTTKLVVTKLLQKDAKLQEAYLDTLIKEVK